MIEKWNNQVLPGFSEDPSRMKGKYAQIEPYGLGITVPKLFYTHSNGEIWVGDAVDWLKSLADASVDLIFADPPYNVKKAEWDNFESQQEYIQWSLRWIKQAARVLKPDGTLYICGYSEILLAKSTVLPPLSEENIRYDSRMQSCV